MSRPTDWTSFFATLVRDYIAAASVESGIPDNDALPKLMQDDTGKSKRPSLLVVCDQERDPHPKMFRGQVHIQLRIATKQDDDSTRDAADLMAALDDRLRDDDAWSAWVQSLSEERRTGWLILRRRVVSTEREVDAEGHKQERTLIMELSAVTKRDT
jgi:hypothetical protein